MSNPPRKHHFIPQFWIKRFAADDGKIWVYDRNDGSIKPRSPKAVMQLFNLYTLEPSGVDDTTLESIELDRIDREGNAAFDRVLNGDYTNDTKEELATFLAAQIMRDPETILSYPSKAQNFTLSLLEIFDDDDYATFLTAWTNHFPDIKIDKEEYDYIRSLNLKGAEDQLEQIILALDEVGGLPELPFTDIIRNTSGRDKCRNALLALDWKLKINTNGDFILGDTGILFQKGMIANGAKAPLSRSASLDLLPSASPADGITLSTAAEYEVKAINFESATRSRRWMVGNSSTILDGLKSQISGNGFAQG